MIVILLVNVEDPKEGALVFFTILCGAFTIELLIFAGGRSFCGFIAIFYYLPTPRVLDLAALDAGEVAEKLGVLVDGDAPPPLPVLACCL